jgi:hypothetical protein
MHLTRWLGVLMALVLITGCATRTATQTQNSPLILTAPAHRLVYQRGTGGTGFLPVAGTSPLPRAKIEVRVSEVENGSEVQPWRQITQAGDDGVFNGRLQIKGGWYRVEVRAMHRRHQATAIVERVGVGEVFIVVGHSVAHGGRTNLATATSDLVNTIAWPTNSDTQRKEYELTANPQLLPGLVGAHYADGIQPAPFGNGAYFWAQFAEHVSKAQGVPVLLLNAAFGGTSLEHWAKSARGEQFEHSFVKSSLRMPYVNLHHALRRYASVTGVRAILADQGQNDWPENDAGKVFANYSAWIKQARADLAFPALAIVVNRASPPGNRPVIRRVQEQVIREVPHCYPGPDYDTLRKTDRYDDVHFAASGLPHAAELWASALTDSFFKKATPYQPGE